MADEPKKDQAKEKKEAKKDEAKKESASPKLTKIIEEIEKLSVLELNDLVKALEEKFDITAAPAMAVSAAAPVTESADEEKGVSQQTTFNVVLAETGDKKIQVIKTLREINQNLGLKEAKELADNPPKQILEGVNKETAGEAKKKLEEAGAKVELK